jgi:hypothetical protein
MAVNQNGVYKTSKGNTIDMNKLVNKNELTMAVGNVKVNARGDKLGPGGKIVKTVEEIQTVGGAPAQIRVPIEQELIEESVAQLKTKEKSVKGGE